MHTPLCHTCPPFALHAPLCHTCPLCHACPQQPHMPPANTHTPWQPCTPPGNHACSPATMHTPQQPCMPPPATTQAHQQPCMPLQQPRMPPPCEQNHTLLSKHNLAPTSLRAVTSKGIQKVDLKLGCSRRTGSFMSAVSHFYFMTTDDQSLGSSLVNCANKSLYSRSAVFGATLLIHMHTGKYKEISRSEDSLR